MDRLVLVYKNKWVYKNIKISHYMTYILVCKDGRSSESFCRAQDIILYYQ